MQTDLLPSLSRQLTSDQAASCEGDLTLEEITVALNQRNTNKAPGSDGLSVEFYSKFWNRLGPYMCQVFNACSQAGEMCESMQTSSTRVIYKKGDRKDLKNWRPISLLMSIIRYVANLFLSVSLKFYSLSLILIKPVLCPVGKLRQTYTYCRIF